MSLINPSINGDLAEGPSIRASEAPIYFPTKNAD